MRRSWLAMLLILPGLALANDPEERTGDESTLVTPPGEDQGQTATNRTGQDDRATYRGDRTDKKKADKADMQPAEKALGKIHKIHQHEIQLGQLGQQRANDPQVREYARTLEQDHTKADMKLGSLAINEGVDLEQTMAKMDARKDKKDKAQKLQGLSGTEFDREFLTMMVDGHEKALEKLAQLQEDVNDEQILAYIEETRPTIERHLERARTLQEQITRQASR